MSETLEVRIRHEALSDAARSLADWATGEDSMHLPCSRAIPPGEWVRFRIVLADGTHVLEGVGRCDGVARSDEVGGARVHLSRLQFDERNEIMYERVLLAREDDGEATGRVPLESLGLSSAPSSGSIPPAPPRSAAGPRPPAPATKIGTPSRTSQGTRPRQAPLRTPAKAAPNDEAPTRDTIISRPPVVDPDGRDDLFRIPVPADMVARAVALASALPKTVLDTKHLDRSPEEMVLRAAIRLGLASLSALAEIDEDR